MGQKVNPHGYRVGVIKNWDSRWFAKDEVFGDTLVEDYNLRKYLKKTLYSAGIAKVEIERDDKRVRLHIHCAKPGMVIGRGGDGIDEGILAVVFGRLADMGEGGHQGGLGRHAERSQADSSNKKKESFHDCCFFEGWLLKFNAIGRL